MGFKVKIKGNVTNFDKLAKADTVLDEVLDDVITDIESDAKVNVDSIAKTKGGHRLPIGGLIRSNFYLEKAPLYKEVGVNPFSFEGRYRSWAAFMEFGTGKFIDIPNGLKKYARTFYINGRGTILPSAFLFTAVEDNRLNALRKIKEAFK